MLHTNQGSQFAFNGKGSELALLLLKNILLSVVTLGIYYPWGKTAVRKYLWSRSSLDGHGFEYTGTGKELFLGYVKVLAFYLLFVGMQILAAENTNLSMALNLGVAITFMALLPFILFSSHGYLTSRIRYRGIAFAIDKGKRTEICRVFYRDVFFSLITFGIYIPAASFNLFRGLINATSYGSLGFSNSGNTVEYFKIVWTNIFLSLVTLNIYQAWAFARDLGYRIETTKLGNLRFETSFSGLKILGLFILGLVGFVLTLGLAGPWIRTLFTSYALKNISTKGSIDFASVHQLKVSEDGKGNAAVDFFDLDGVLV